MTPPLPPVCSQCGRRHHIEEPHFLTEEFRQWWRDQYGTDPYTAHAFAHCTGAMYATAMAALQSSDC